MKLNNKSSHDGAENSDELVQSLSVGERTSRFRSKRWLWQITLFSLALSSFFGVISELMLSHTHLALALILIFILMCFSVIFDIIGMAVTAANMKVLLENKSRDVKGANIAIWLVKNAEKVSCICTDVVGDICSILSGAAGAAISIIIITNVPSLSNFFVSIGVSALIASINVLAKAIGKTYAISSSDKILLKLGKLLAFLGANKKNKK